MSERIDHEWRVSLPCVSGEARPLDPGAAVWRRAMVFACDGDVVRAIDPAAGKVFRLAGGGSDHDVAEGPAKLACFRGVAGIAADDAGLWFGDTGGGAVRRMRFASDSVSTLADSLPGPVALVRADTTLYVACREGELFEIDTSTGERRSLETVRDGVITSLAIVERTVYAATAAGLLIGVDRTSRRVTQRMEVDGMPYSIAAHPHHPSLLQVALPGRIERVRVPDGRTWQVTEEGAVTRPHALAHVRKYGDDRTGYSVPGLYFFDVGNLCWLQFSSKQTTVIALDG